MVLTWDDAGKHLYETGVDRGVLYPVDTTTSKYGTGVAWNGLTGFTESPSGAEATALWADNGKYLNLYSVEEFGGTITAYTWPDEFEECDGSRAVNETLKGVTVGQQTRKMFGFSYRTIIGNDIAGSDYGYKIHLVYGCVASPSEKDYASVNDTPDPVEFSWELSTTPVAVSGLKKTSTLVIDSTKVTPKQLKAIEDALYGTAEKQPTLPLPDEVISIMTNAAA